MADQSYFTDDDVISALDKSYKLRNELASKAGKPDAMQDKNLEIGLGDAGAAITGSLLSNVGTGIKEASIGDMTRAARKVADGSFVKGAVDAAVSGITDKSSEELSKKGLLTDALGLDGVGFVGVDPSKNPVKEAASTFLNKAADTGEYVADKLDSYAVNPVAEVVGGGVKAAGDGIKDWMSDDAKEAAKSSAYTQDENGDFHLGNMWSDPARASIKLLDSIGSMGGTVVAGLLTGGAVKGMVMRTMLKRGASEGIAKQTAEMAAQKWSERAVAGEAMSMSVGQAADQSRESYGQLSDDDKLNSPIFGDTVKSVYEQHPELSSSQRMAIVDEQMRDKMASFAKSDPSTYAAAAAGTMLGDSMLFKMVTGKAGASEVTGGLLSRAAQGFAKGGLGEGVGEAVEEGVQQNVQNRASNAIGGTNIDPMQGVALAAAEAGTMGALTGGAVGSVSSVAHGSSKPAQPSESPEQQVGDTQTLSDATQPADLNSTAPVVEDAPDMETAINEVYGDDVQTKVPGSFSIGKDESGYRAAYVDDNGELQVSEPYATPDEAQKIVTGGQVIRQDISQAMQPTNETQQPNEGAETTQPLEVEPQTAIDGQDQAATEANQQLPVDGLQNINALQAELPAIPTQLEQAPTNSNDIFGQLTTVRVTKRGNPFASQKEAQLASRKTETPIELPTGGFGVVDKAEFEQVQASQNQSLITTQQADVNDTNVADINQAADPVDVNESMQNQVVAQNQPDINANEQSQAVIPEITESNAIKEQPNVQQKIPVIASPELPWTGYKDKADGTMILEGDPVALKAWAKENDITAIKSKTGIVVGRGSVPTVKDFISKQQETGNVTSNGQLSTVPGTSDVAASNNTGGGATVGELVTGEQSGNANSAITDANNAEVAVVEPGRNGRDNALANQEVLKSKSADNANKSGISKEEVDRVVEEFKREYKGNIPLDVKTFQSQEDAYGPEATTDKAGRIEGGYQPASKQVHLIADNIRPQDTQRKLAKHGRRELGVEANSERGVSGNSSFSTQRTLNNNDAVRRVLHHEILGHYGLNTFTPEEKRTLIGKITKTRSDSALGKIWEGVDKNYPDTSESRKAEEVFAHIAEEKHGLVSDAWNRVLSSLHGVMRRNGMLNKDVTLHELREYARSIAKGIKSGERKQQIFPSDNESQYRKTETETADKGGFSLSTMPKNEAEISGKGMTKPEAVVVAKQWLRQFKTDINVAVVKDQAEFESALADRGFANSIQSGEMDNAAYLPDSKTILINASAIHNPKRLKQIMRHEILVHHGLRYVVGEDAYAKIINAIAQGYKTSPSIKAAVDTVTKNYADKDMFTQMEEAFAHYAENIPADSGPIGRLWQRIISMVKSALQKVNFVSVNESEQQLDSVLHAIAKNMRKGIEDGVLAERSNDAMFSRSSTADDELMTKLGLGPKQDAIDKAKERINNLKQADREQVKSWIDETTKKANTQILDYLAPIKYAEDAGGKIEASDSGYVAARLASGSATVMNATMLHGLPAWKDGVIQRKDGTGEADSLLGIFESLGSDLHNWLGWMAGHRGEILLAEGRENLLTPEDILALKDKGNGKETEFEAARKKWNALNKAVLDLAEEAGLFTAEDRAKWDSEWYVPFFRETEDGDVTGPYKHKGIANQTAGIKKLKGGAANVNDILQNIFTTTSKTIDAAMKNMAAQKVAHNLVETDLITVLEKPNLMEIQAASKNQGNKLLVKIEGENYVIQINDEPLFNAMTMIDQKRERNAITRSFMKAKHLLTAGTTSVPSFMARNFIRDAASTWVINEDGFKPIIDSVRGAIKSWNMDESSINMMFSGASFMGGNLRGNDPEAMASAVRKALRRKGMSPEQIDQYEKTVIRTGKQAMDFLGKYWEQYERVGEAIENGSREAVYEAAIKAGKTHAQAAFEAKDLMDFSMHGSSKIMQWFVDVLPFFNARMQGLGKLGRAIKANPKQIARRGGMIAGASLALLARNWDDDRYNDLPDWDKDMNWHFWFGDQHVRIPKPFEIGLMFGSLPERMARVMGGKDTVGKFGKIVALNMLDTLAINPIPQAIRPLVEDWVNYDFFRGAQIDNMIDQNRLPEARYDERTSLLMRELGDITGFSPKKLEHLVTGYTGSFGAYVLGIADSMVRGIGDYGSAPASRAEQIPLLGTFFQGSAPARSTQSMQDFYSLLRESNQVYSTIREYVEEGKTEDAGKLKNENIDTLRKRPMLNHAQKQFNALRNEMELIERDKLLNADQKRERIDKLLKRRNDFAAKLIMKFEQ